MNAHSKGLAIALRAPRHSAEPEPATQSPPSRASVDYRGENRELRDQLQAERLRTIRAQGAAKRAIWALQGACKELERKGVPVTYWRALAAELEGRL